MKNYHLKKISTSTYNKALKEGVITRPSICSKCLEGNKRRIIGHHEDYANPLDVLWLCDKCHQLRHIEIRDSESKPQRKKCKSSCTRMRLKDYIDLNIITIQDLARKLGRSRETIRSWRDSSESEAIVVLDSKTYELEHLELEKVRIIKPIKPTEDQS